MRHAEVFIAAFAVVVALSAVLTRLVRDIGRRRGLLDVPNQRSSHVQPTPRTGGLAIAIATTIGWVAWLVLVSGSPRAAVVLIVGAVLSGAVGLADDLYSLEPGPKFLGLAAVAVPAALLLPSAIPGWPANVVAAGAAIWILSYTNALNFMDGSDGLAAGAIAIVASVIAAMSLAAGDAMLAWFASATAAAVTAFLFFNSSPASVFMGDAGSYFLGFSVAVMLLLAVADGVGLVTAVLLIHPFLFDTSFTLVRRIWRREQFWRAHREHLYQRLLVTGWSHRAVARRYYLWQIVAAASALGYEYGDWPLRFLAAAVAVTATWALLATVTRAERAHILGPTPAVGAQ